MSLGIPRFAARPSVDQSVFRPKSTESDALLEGDARYFPAFSLIAAVSPLISNVVPKGFEASARR
jgi:hypothetical protein